VPGRDGSSTLMTRIQPHGHPNDEVVNVPYTSSMLTSKDRPGTGTAEWLSEQPPAVPPAHCDPVPQMGRLAIGVNKESLSEMTVPGFGLLTTALVSSTSMPPRRYAMYVVLPSTVGVIECSERSKS